MLTRALLALLVISCAMWPASAEDTKVVALGLADHAVTEAELAAAAPAEEQPAEAPAE